MRVAPSYNESCRVGQERYVDKERHVETIGEEPYYIVFF